MTNNLSKFERSLRIKLKNKILLKQALTHKSSNPNKNNEKLEFLGDRVIGLILSEKLLELYPSENEGVLDKKFAFLVNRKTCCTMAWLMGIQNFIIVGNSKRKINFNDQKILSDACEAVIGAIYIDRGFNYVKNFVLKLWRKEIDKSSITVFDSKTKLQEHSLKLFKKLPIYELLEIKGPRHKPTFKISVSISGTKKFFGTGKSKQQAELDGATNLLKGIKNL